jgi:hypothetical protein
MGRAAHGRVDDLRRVEIVAFTICRTQRHFRWEPQRSFRGCFLTLESRTHSTAKTTPSASIRNCPAQAARCAAIQDSRCALSNPAGIITSSPLDAAGAGARCRQPVGATARMATTRTAKPTLRHLMLNLERCGPAPSAGSTAALRLENPLQIHQNWAQRPTIRVHRPSPDGSGGRYDSSASASSTTRRCVSP